MVKKGNRKGNFNESFPQYDITKNEYDITIEKVYIIGGGLELHL